MKSNYVPTYEEGFLSLDEMDNLTHNRFNINNYNKDIGQQLKNYYVFKVLDLDETSKTGYYGMAVKKDVADKIVEYANKKQFNFS